MEDDVHLDKEEHNPWEKILMVVALVLAILFYEVFPLWIEIESAGGRDAWLQDSDGLIAKLLITLAHFII